MHIPSRKPTKCFNKTDSLFKMFKNTEREPQEKELTSQACVFLLHLLPVVFGWEGLEPRLTYYFSRHSHDSRCCGFSFFFSFPEKQGRKKIGSERGRDADDITMNDMFSARGTWRAAHGVRMNASTQQNPDDTDEPALCADLSYVRVPVLGLNCCPLCAADDRGPAKPTDLPADWRIYHQRKFITQPALPSCRYLCSRTLSRK